MNFDYKLDVPSTIIDQIFLNFRTVAQVDNGNDEFHRKLANEAVSATKCKHMFSEITQFVDFDKITRFLELGSGYSCLVALMNKWGVDAYGIEPAFESYASYQIAREILAKNNVEPGRVIDAPGEKIPFPNNHFSVIYSTQVLEHTQDPEKVLSEVIRVLEPNGTAILNFPNYGSWWEGHYGMFMLPYCPKWLFKLQVGLFGRDTSYINSLQFLTYRKLKKWLKKYEGKIQIMTTGQEIWEKRVRTLEFQDFAQTGKIKTVLKILKKTGLTEFVIWLGKKLHWETPFVIVFKKN